MGFTKEQQLAINEIGKNIIVSAGAGSGKTAVLTARVINHLQRGIHIHELLILTFTKAAAGEMKERIRNAIKKDDSLKEELKTIDQAYITTFDSFALSLVKKYHYLLNLPQNPKITDETLIRLLRINCLKQVFNDLYEEENFDFLEMVDTFCIKDDSSLFSEILNIATKIETIPDIFNYLETDNQDFSLLFKEYQDLVYSKREELKSVLEEFSYQVDQDYFEKVRASLQPIFDATDYEEIRLVLSIKIPSVPRGSDEEVKIAKEKVANKYKELVEMFRYGDEDCFEKDFLQYQHWQKVLKMILQKYFTLYLELKKANAYYDFETIAHYSLQLLQEFPNVLEEVKSSFKEIMVDEYQDTNDLQEAFIKLLENDNVYMVGDIKQSIYRFRNANPYIFKTKYDAYTNGKGGMKIDLLKNFRSRDEVLQNINLIFNPLMDDYLGGANYLASHQMNFGNLTYETVRGPQSYQMEINTYPLAKDLDFKKEEIEAFFVVNDILKRIKNKEQVFDKNTNQLRDITYQDFCILMDRTTDFNLYRKIFQYKQVPLTLFKDEILSDNIHFILIKNFFVILTKLKDHNFDYDFKISYLSLARSFLFEEKDLDIEEIVLNHKWYDSKVIKCLKDILKGIDGKVLPDIIDEILVKTNYYEKLIKIGNIEDSIYILEKMKDFANQASEFGYNYVTFCDYLDSIIKEGLQVKYSLTTESLNSVKIMTIHKSKGLEFSYCYFTGLYKKFNLSELKEKFLWDNHYGFITPVSKEGIQDIFIKDLVKNNFYREEISEKIRLFYVALTRAKEKMVFVLPESQTEFYPKNDGVIKNEIRMKYRSFADFLNSLSFLKNYQTKIDYQDLGLTKDYLKNVKKDQIFSSTGKIEVQELPKIETFKETQVFSQPITFLVDKETKINLELGIKIHEILQFLNFKNPDFDLINDSFLKEKVQNFWHQELIQQNLDGKFYQEYEFYEEGEELHHGIIDLFIENKQEIILIDYKLEKTSNDHYLLQLNGYRNYLQKTFNKPVKMYLYSILNNQFQLLN